MLGGPLVSDGVDGGRSWASRRCVEPPNSEAAPLVWGRRRELKGLAAVPMGGGRTATGDTDGTEVTQKSPTKNRAGPLPVQNSPSTSRTAALPVQNSPSRPLLTACAVQNSPCWPKMALFGTFFACMANFVPFSPGRSRAWRTLYRMRGRDGSSHHSTPGPTGVEGAGGN